MQLNRDDEWRNWCEAMALFQQEVTAAFQQMIIQAAPVEADNPGAGEVKQAAEAFDALAREYVDGVRDFVGGLPIKISTAKRLKRLGDAMEKALDEYNEAKDMDPTDRRIEVVTKAVGRPKH